MEAVEVYVYIYATVCEGRDSQYSKDPFKLYASWNVGLYAVVHDEGPCPSHEHSFWPFLAEFALNKL